MNATALAPSDRPERKRRLLRAVNTIAAALGTDADDENDQDDQNEPAASVGEEVNAA